MDDMAGASHVSIGDVLDQLRPEFEDITISKIRFLESQGLVDPERTPSGYRKFYPADVERLRFILREQRENFLPLKVIKERLADLDSGAPPTDAAPTADGAIAEVAGVDPPADNDADKPAAPKKARKRKAAAPTEPVAAEPAAAEPLFETTRRAAEVDEARAAAALVTDEGGPDEHRLGETEVTLTRTELAKAAGITDAELGQLEEYGLVIPAHTSRDRVLFDEDALAIAKVASNFMRHGIEARHLRMYRAFAEREGGLFEQVLLPYRRQRNPEAQARTRESLGELSGLGRQLRTALLRQAVRRSLSG
jgi:DNA-binding transcriptional MerR regulator